MLEICLALFRLQNCSLLRDSFRLFFVLYENHSKNKLVLDLDPFSLFFCDILMILLDIGCFVFKMGNELIPEKNLVEEVWRIYTKFFLQ